jgi:hypothetical protein
LAATILAVEGARLGERPRPLTGALLPRPAALFPVALDRRLPAVCFVAVGTLDVMAEVSTDVGNSVDDAHGDRLLAPAPVPRAYPRTNGLVSREVDEMHLSQVEPVGRRPSEVRGDEEPLRAPNSYREKQAALEVHVVWARRLRYMRGDVDRWTGSTLLFVQVIVRPKVAVVRRGVGRLYRVPRTNWG